MNRCPSRKRLQQLLDESLPEADRAAVEQHLDQCSSCQAEIENLTGDPETANWSHLHHQAHRLEHEPSDLFLDRLTENLSHGLGEDPVIAATRVGKVTKVPNTELPKVPGYEVLAEIGRGGMGVIYRAHHHALNRLVALKMILASNEPGNEESARFRREAETLAALQHPNIVQVFEVGAAQGCMYLALELVQGPSLAEAIRGKPQSPEFAARTVETLGRAVHYAHQRGIVHRDLKPANILLQGIATDKHGLTQMENREPSFSVEVYPCSSLAAAIPKIADFGLAKQLRHEDEVVRTGQVLGTPSYMAPEQVRGNGQSIGPATDVHSLGSILYELLTGRPPFRGESPTETVLQVVHDEPAPPSRLRSRLPRDLETICLKCLRKEPSRRYASALALADDLHHFLANKPIQARPTPVWEQTWKWARRQPAVAGLAILLVVVIVVGFVLVLNESRQAAANAQAQKAARRDSDRLLALSYLDQGISHCERGNVSTGMLWMVRSLELADRLADESIGHTARANLAAWRHQIVRRRASLTNPDWVAAVAFSPDGKLALTGNRDKTARLCDVTTCLPTCPPLIHDYPVWAVAFSMDGRTILTGSGDDDPFYSDYGEKKWTVAIHAGGKRFRPNQAITRSRGEVRLWDAASGKLLGAALQCPGSVVSVQWSGDGRALLSVGAGHALIWKRSEEGSAPETKSPWTSFPLEHPEGVLAATFDPSGRSVVTGGMDGNARQWDTATGRPVGPPMPHSGPVNITLFHPAGHALLTGSILMAGGQTIQAGEARLWQIATHQPLGPPLRHRGPLKGAAFNADGQIVVTGGYAVAGEPQHDSPGEARVWDTATGQLLCPPLEHPEVVTSVAVSPDGRLVATGCRDGNVRFWIPANGQPLAQSPRSVQCNQGTVAQVVFSPDGRMLLAGNLTSLACAALLEVPSGPALSLPLRHGDQVSEAVFSPDGRLILTGSADNKARLWDASTGRPSGEPLVHPASVQRIAFSPDGQTFATSCVLRTVQIWDTASRKPRGQRIPSPNHIDSLSYSPDGKHLLAAGEGTSVFVWDVATGNRINEVRIPSATYAVAYSRQQGTVLTGSSDGFARLWDLTTWEPLRSWRHPSAITGVSISPDGQYFATGGSSRSAQIWRIDSDQPFGPPLLHSKAVFHVSFSPNGRTLLTCSEDKTARLWDVSTGRPIGPPLTHRDMVLDVAFSPDNEMMLTASQDGTAIRWDVPQPLTADVETIRLWAEAITSLHMDDGGAVRELPEAAWQERVRVLQEIR